MNRKRICRTLPATWLLASAAMLSGCVSDEGTCPPGGTAKPLTLTLNVAVPAPTAPGTRTYGHTTTEPGSNAENYISFDDYKLIVFGRKGNFLTDGIRMQKQGVGTTSTDGYTIHTLVGEIPNPLGQDDNNKEELTTFSLMLLANTEAFTPAGTPYNFTGTSIASGNTNNIFTDGTKFNFTVPHETDATTTTTTSWTPSAEQGIPMFGLVNLNLKTANGEWNGDKTGTTLNMVADMPVLRSLAKIEIVDMVPDNKNADIDKVVLTKYNTTGRLIPDITNTENGKWDQLGTQVSSPSLPDATSVSVGTNLNFAEEKRTVSVTNSDGTTSTVEKAVFVAYVPEMELSSMNEKPILEVYAQGKDKPFEIQLSPYSGGKPVEKTEGGYDYYDYLLRNHIYKFNILSVSSVNAELTLMIDTDDWDNDEDEYYYDDLAVEFKNGGEFKWKWDYDNIDPSDPVFDKLAPVDYERVMEWDEETLQGWTGKNIVVNRSGQSSAEATFTIKAPERGTWTLALYGDELTPNHWFQIEIWDETTQEWVLTDQRIDDSEHNVVADNLTGSIAPIGGEPKEVKIRISAQDLQYEAYPYRARLVMNVRSFDGRMAEVDLTTGKMVPPPVSDDESDGRAYYYIIQYPTPLQ